MLFNRFSTSHGRSWAAAVFAASVAAGLAGAASASTIIYQDNFTGSATTPLNGAAPTVDNGPSATWKADTGSTGYIGFADSGYTSENNSGGAAYLNFTPVSGNIYTLSASINAITGANPNTGDDWLSIGYLTAPATSMRFDNGSNGGTAWALLRTVVNTPVANQSDGTLFEGVGTGGYGHNFNTLHSGANTLSSVLNTEGSNWTFQIFLNGTAVSNLQTFSSNPAITAVGIGNDGSVTDGTFANFELTASPVPEPAALGLAGVGALGLLFLKRRRNGV